MTTLRRLVYLGYYMQKMNWTLLRRFMAHVLEQHGMGRGRQMVAFVRDSLRYNISPLEWYQFGFVSLSPQERSTWAGTGTMYEFQRHANPPDRRQILNDKRAFHRAYRNFYRHNLWSLEELEQDQVLVERILAEHDKLVFKDAAGNCGTSVHIVPSAGLSASRLPRWMRKNGFDMVESLIQQHPDLQTLSPSGVNTVRVITLLDKQGEYHVLGCRLRISVNSAVDNLAAGNLAAPIDKANGMVTGPGVYSDITRKSEAVHPVTGIGIEGFQIPFWHKTLEMVRQASFMHPENRSVGWDVVITPNGPGLIEGNHDWCKLVWQLPVQTGLKTLLEHEL